MKLPSYVGQPATKALSQPEGQPADCHVPVRHHAPRPHHCHTESALAQTSQRRYKHVASSLSSLTITRPRLTSNLEGIGACAAGTGERGGVWVLIRRRLSPAAAVPPRPQNPPLLLTQVSKTHFTDAETISMSTTEMRQQAFLLTGQCNAQDKWRISRGMRTEARLRDHCRCVTGCILIRQTNIIKSQSELPT